MKKILLLAIIILTSCTARIDINTEDAEPRLVIFGLINSDSTRHFVQITRSTGYFSNEEPPAISGAEVTISYDSEILYLTESPERAGLYQTDSICGIPYKTYTLDVWLDFNNDGIKEHYQASSTMPKGPRVDAIMPPMIVPDMNMMIVMLFGEVFHEQDNYFCIYTSKNNEPKKLLEYFAILPDAMINSYENIYPFPYFAQGGIQKGDTVNFRIDDLDAEYSNFLSQASAETGVSMPFFSAPPAEIVTNIKCLTDDIRVSGFFAAYHRVKDLMTISDIDFNFMGM
jgi:hypothetical protein